MNDNDVKRIVWAALQKKVRIREWVWIDALDPTRDVLLREKKAHQDRLVELDRLLEQTEEA